MSQQTRAQYAVGQTGKVVAARILPGSDLLTGIEALCKENQLESATILSCFGSFQEAGYFYLIPKPEAKAKAGYGDLVKQQGPIEFLNGTGVVCKRDGSYEVHLHGTMCDQSGHVFGGHLVKGENTVLTVDIVIAEAVGIQFIRQLDEETGANQFYPVEEGRSTTTLLTGK